MNTNAPNIWSKSWRILPWKKLQSGEALLAWGLAFLAAAVAFIHFVMGWILAGMAAPFAMIFLALGIFRARDSAASAQRQSAGLALLLLGTLALWAVAFLAASLSYKLAIHVQAPGFAARHQGSVPGLIEWVLHLGSWLIPAFFMLCGLSFWTNWTPRRRWVWCVIILAVPLVALLFHQFLAALGGPLTA